MINSINLYDVIEILNTRIINATNCRNNYQDFSENYNFRMYCTYDGIVDELCEIRDEFEARIIK